MTCKILYVCLVKYILLLLFVALSTIAFCQTKSRFRLVEKRVDSLLRIGDEYKEVVQQISRIPDSSKEVTVMTIDSPDSAGNKTGRDKCRYAVGYKAKGKNNAHYIYYIWYSVNQNRILHVSDIESWEHATDNYTVSSASKAQKQLTDAETQNFYRLIRQTKEFITCKGKVDSFNKAVGEQQIHQEIKLEIVARNENVSDDNIFEAVLERRLTIGLSMESYFFQYDKQKKQIVSVRCEKGRFQMN
jgi:hypothetical protein